jgi:aspartate beta-hydroxylase
MTQAAAQFLRQQALDALEIGDLSDAEQKMRAAISVWPDAPLLHLEYGHVLELLARTDAATRSYFRAVTKARAKGMWLDESTVAPAILPLLLHAMAFAEKHRPDVLHALLDSLYAQFGREELTRVSQALDIYLGLDTRKPSHSAQRPLFLYVPGLSETPYLDAKRFTWVEAALAACAEIAQEARVVLTKQNALQPFLDAPPGGDLSAYLAASAQQAPRWDAFFFYRHGHAFTENLAAAPKTAEFLQRMPLIRIPEHAPEICFSVLAPGTRILPHTGVSNLRVVAHLPLILPGQCALKVAGMERAWALDEVLVFDDTFEHEAWNFSDSVRVILLMDAWHPDLRESEQAALSQLIEGIGVFNRS